MSRSHARMPHQRRSTTTAAAALLVLALLAIQAHALIHHLEIRHDTRGKFFIENFGFEPGGLLRLNCSGLSIEPMPESPDPPAPNTIGFYITYSQTDSPRFIEEHEDSPCLLQVKQKSAFERVYQITSWFVGFSPWSHHRVR